MLLMTGFRTMAESTFIKVVNQTLCRKNLGLEDFLP